MLHISTIYVRSVWDRCKVGINYWLLCTFLHRHVLSRRQRKFYLPFCFSGAVTLLGEKPTKARLAFIKPPLRVTAYYHSSLVCLYNFMSLMQITCTVSSYWVDNSTIRSPPINSTNNFRPRVEVGVTASNLASGMSEVWSSVWFCWVMSSTNVHVQH